MRKFVATTLNEKFLRMFVENTYNKIYIDPHQHPI